MCFWNFDEDFHCGELGYELNRAHWRKGIMAEALPAVIAYGFNDLGLHRIEATLWGTMLPRRIFYSSSAGLRKLIHGNYLFSFPDTDPSLSITGLRSRRAWSRLFLSYMALKYGKKRADC
jgi:hypothetical protein